MKLKTEEEEQPKAPKVSQEQIVGALNFLLAEQDKGQEQLKKIDDLDKKQLDFLMRLDSFEGKLLAKMADIETRALKANRILWVGIIILCLMVAGSYAVTFLW